MSIQVLIWGSISGSISEGFQGVVFTRGLHQSSTWPQLYAAELLRVHTAVMQVYSSALREDDDVRGAPSHEAIAQCEGFIAPAIMILYMRLCLFTRACACWHLVRGLPPCGTAPQSTATSPLTHAQRSNGLAAQCDVPPAQVIDQAH